MGYYALHEFWEALNWKTDELENFSNKLKLSQYYFKLTCEKISKKLRMMRIDF